MLERKCIGDNFRDVGDGFGHFDHQHPLSFYICVEHQHSKYVTNIEIPQPTSTNRHQFKVTNITVTVAIFENHFKSRFYGSQDRLNLTDQQWLELNKIDIEHFLYVTRPKYKMLMCDLQGHDCKHRWMFKRTYFGYCLQQNASWFFRIHPKTTSNTRFR